ncbi:phosphatidylglycerophosphatase A [uncultured Thalassospira sp.]|jgi:phosphatidylglycerophosphatase A|uniref:phosphatidylglycerophosphatase A family protein n=1 Tax=uncultured Thalassospira sp. TaxID=404382 RepID=UPI0030DC27BB|tara:strand:+ start:24339 stop:24830 length:492 start_codon:yes stop_codon:yes gene_type:complete
MRLNQIIITASATWFYSGKVPKAPGTAGSLAALPLGWILVIAGSNTTLLLATAIVFIYGVFVSDSYSKMIGIHDPGEIVIDEVAGQWLCLLAVPLSGSWMDIAWMLLAFVVFRFFDILKPWPISWVDRRVGGGFGIMFDDILAGGFGMILLALVSHFAEGFLK